MDKSDMDAVGFGDKRVEVAKFGRYAGVKDRTDRIAFISSSLYRGWRYYYEPKRTSFRPPKDATVASMVQKELGFPDQKFLVVVFHYTTDEEGELQNQDKLSGKVKLWLLSESKYEELTAISRQWPLLNTGQGERQHDLLITCTEEKFQQMKINPCPDAHWKSKESWYTALVAKEELARSRSKGVFGRQLTDTEILSLLGLSMGSQTGSTDNTAEIDLASIMEE